VRARALLDTLARARPPLARRETGSGIERVPTFCLRAGDIVHVDGGEPLPADGILLDACAEIDESLLTGESKPVVRDPGDLVLAGSVSHARVLRVRATHVGRSTRIAELERLVEAAQSARPRIARVADAVARRMVVALFLAAAGVFVAWLQVDPGRAFEIALAVLVVTCPCALSLAVPSVVAATTAALAREGVLTLDADALETLARVDRVVLDKTGTLTVGHPRVGAVTVVGDTSGAEAIALAASMQRGVVHPLARAFEALALGRGLDPSPHSGSIDARSVPGEGVCVRREGHDYRLGRAGFATGGDDDEAIWLSRDRIAIARFEVEDALRPEAEAVVARLRAHGAEVEIASGDAEAAVARSAHALGIVRWRSRCSAADKLARARELQSQGRIVAMVGDGINDAPVLAGVDVSIALGGGASLARRSADVVLLGDSIEQLPLAFALARRMRRVVRQNFGWAIGYNLVALPIAATGWIGPGTAAAGMALSSLLVAANALRLMRVRR
jgi:Cu2+-exporting ATPase